jgi:hypothetical protein
MIANSSNLSWKVELTKDQIDEGCEHQRKVYNPKGMTKKSHVRS